MPDMILDDLEVKTHFNLDEAISSIRFFWNLAQHKGLSVRMILTGDTSVKGGAKKNQERKVVSKSLA